VVEDAVEAGHGDDDLADVAVYMRERGGGA
jgi:hypothetical protein